MGSNKAPRTNGNVAFDAKKSNRSSNICSNVSNHTENSVSSTSSILPWKAYPSWQYERLVDRHGREQVKLLYFVRHAEGTHNVNREYNNIDNLDARLTTKGRQQCRELRNEMLDYAKRAASTQDAVSSKDSSDCIHRQAWNHLLQEISPVGQDNMFESEESSVCVVTSPLSRCVETALLSFDFLLGEPGDSEIDGNDSGHNSISRSSLVAHESLRETVNFHCDRRRPISEIARDYPKVDFSHCAHDEDHIWTSLLSMDRYRYENEKGGHLESASLHLVAQRGVDALNFVQSLPHSKVVVCTHSAYLRCILSWGHPGGVPLMVKQGLDQRNDSTRQEKILDYSCILCEEFEGKDDHPTRIELGKGLQSFEDYMRKDYANAELRSFCLLVRQQHTSNE